MKHLQKKSRICLLILFLLLTGCSAKVKDGQQIPPAEEEAEQTLEEQGESSTVDITQNTSIQSETSDDAGDGKIVNEAVWVVYWDDEDYVSKLMDGAYDPEIICEFEAYFDGKHTLVKEDRVKEQFTRLKALPGMEEKKFYLTFVNDVVTDGSSSQKDTEVLYDVLKDPAKHASDVVKAAKEDGYDGIEIDYEKIRDDLKLWEMFTAFENELIREADKEGIPLRIVLEPSTPVEKIGLPEGPEYVVMCYNLYGYGTKPGPKADRDFLIELADRFEPLSGNLGFAFANGGFDWDLKKDTIEPLTDLQGKKLIQTEGKNALRDEKSHDLTFTYEKDGHKHEVYFADEETIAFWAGVIHEHTGRKVRINIWRN